MSMTVGVRFPILIHKRILDQHYSQCYFFFFFHIKRFGVGLNNSNMFGFYTRIQFSVFKSKILRVPQLKILFSYCFPFLYSNSITVFLILKSSLLRTTFGCFLFQYLFSFNKIIIFFLVYFFSPDNHHRNSLSFSALPLSWWVL
jgi:hypothetical protein